MIQLSSLVFFQAAQIKLISSHTFFSVLMLNVKNENICHCAGGGDGGGGGIGGTGVGILTNAIFEYSN